MQGRFKRDGGAAGDPEPRGGADRGPEPRNPADDAGHSAPAGQQAARAGAPADGGPAAPRAAKPSGPADAKGGKSGKGAKSLKDPSAKGAAIGDVEPPVTGKEQGKHASSRLAMRNWSIRTRLVSLLALPVVAATTLGALRIQSSLENVSQLDHMKLLTEMTGSATKLADALQDERDASAGPITSGHVTDDSVVASREETDREVTAFQKATDNINSNDPSLVGVRSTVIDITRQLQTLKQIRDNAYNHTQYISQTVSGYDQLITSLLSLSQDMAQATSNSDMIRSTRALAAFTSAKEYESIQRAVISAALANPSGPQLSTSDRLYAQSASDSEDSEIKRFIETYGNGSADLMKALDGGNTVITQADQYRERVLQTPDGITQQPKSYLDWYDEDDTKMQEMSRIEAELLDQMSQQALTLRTSAQQEALLSGALILLVLGVSLVGAFVVARSMIRSLRRLQDTAQEVSQKRLPDLVKQLSESDPQDVDTSVEEIGINTRDEIGRVARAFDDVHREAVRLAAEQALLRGNVNAMFTNLSRRSQGLIQRQLSLISELESREADPDQLSNLFKLDHLATRMRRNGENLLVLAGEEPGRRWTRPVPLVDVLRAAASEVEQYERIELTAVPPTEVAGRVVNDLVHLLAELLENATSFSSPQTKVRVTGHALPDGRVLVEIHDTGIGLSPEDLSDINERLANPPTVDVSVSRRMGLFVVGRLSLRHGIRIQLRPSDSGGTTALVMLPVDLTQGGAKSAPGQQGQGQAQAKRAPAAGGSGSGVGQPIGRAAQRGQVPGGAQRPALTGNHDSGPGNGPGAPGAPAAGGGTNAFGAPVPGPQQQRGAGLPTRQGPNTAPRAPQPAASERPAPSWAQADDRAGADVPRGHDDVLGMDAPEGYERPDYHGTGRDNATTAEFHAPRQPQQPRQDAPRQDGGFDGFGGGVFGPGSTGEFPLPQGPNAPQTPNAPQGAGPASAGFVGDAPTGEFRAPQHAGSGSDVFGPRGRQTPPRRGPQQPPARNNPQAPGNQNPQGPRGPRTGGPQQGLPPRRPREERRPAPAYDDASSTAQFPAIGSLGDQDAASTAQFPAIGAGETAQGRPPRDRQPQQQPPQGPRPPQVPQPQQAPGRPAGRRPEPQLPPAAEPMALPPATSPGDGRSPIFESLESDWFRQQAERTAPTGYADGPAGNDAQAFGGPQAPARREQRQPAAQPPLPQRSPQQSAPPQPGTPHTGSTRPGPAQSGPPQRPEPPRGPARSAGDQDPQASAPQRGPGDTGDTGEWRVSPNDERWRRAEQVREPAAGGVTPSGLPRRVPRANLVPGTAQQSEHTGPQVSRAPDDVRGRLTNLRRGIQQGRSAGAQQTDGRGFGTTHQQER
ncbi:nitrate- and nitrite sensing domain-containing protein [Streptomyces sp. ICBB 8177]|uniref:sensor histidine kinase n=1 Tax=Streptomyces sp. ICBB 8177 TaxID=563922 RepID=UPI000D6778E5|nr:nitrate- and nitrite sensing domain-containing protein [Streptomyces sp. ICBB 8177]PWI44247.1 histidine kinase [Streptomyces sp. ICBB 8177]